MPVKDTDFVAMVHYACIVCGSNVEDSTEIAIHKEFKSLKEIHNKVLGYSDTFCKDCTDKIDNAKELAYFIVVIDESKTENLNNPYRTGQVFLVKASAFKSFVKPEFMQQIEKFKFTFMDFNVAKKLGFPIV